MCMNKMLFENPGPKIKRMANFLFWAETVACVILAFVLGWDRGHRHSEFMPVFFFGFLIGGPLASYCSALLLHGFGEVVEKAGKIGKSNEPAKAIQTRPISNVPKKPVTSSLSKNMADGQVECWACGCEQPRSNIACEMCGEPL